MCPKYLYIYFMNEDNENITTPKSEITATIARRALTLGSVL